MGKMTNLTHYVAAGIAAIAGLLCVPGIHDYLVSVAGKDQYLSVIIPAVLSIAALYHNPKQGDPK